MNVSRSNERPRFVFAFCSSDLIHKKSLTPQDIVRLHPLRAQGHQNLLHFLIGAFFGLLNLLSLNNSFNFLVFSDNLCGALGLVPLL